VAGLVMDETAQQLLANIRIYREQAENIVEQIATSLDGEERRSLWRDLEGLERHIADLKKRL
jgi:hypothetical protein